METEIEMGNKKFICFHIPHSGKPGLYASADDLDSGKLYKEDIMLQVARDCEYMAE